MMINLTHFLIPYIKLFDVSQQKFRKRVSCQTKTKSKNRLLSTEKTESWFVATNRGSVEVRCFRLGDRRVEVFVCKRRKYLHRNTSTSNTFELYRDVSDKKACHFFLQFRESTRHWKVSLFWISLLEFCVCSWTSSDMYLISTIYK